MNSLSAANGSSSSTSQILDSNSFDVSINTIQQLSVMLKPEVIQQLSPEKSEKAHVSQVTVILSYVLKQVQVITLMILVKRRLLSNFAKAAKQLLRKEGAGWDYYSSV